jgi:hypothetical protein
MSLSKEKKEKRDAAAAALLQKNLDDAKAAFDGLGEDATQEQKDTAQAAIDTAQLAIDNVNKPSGKTKKVKFLLSPTGRFNLAYNEGEEGVFEEKQAAELVQAKYAEYVK